MQVQQLFTGDFILQRLASTYVVHTFISMQENGSQV